jgi:prepilin-type N-terminal cleavage/methylation domain-containing protein
MVRPLRGWSGGHGREITNDTNRGFTLVELTLAMVIFVVVIGFTAQALASYYASMDLTEQRTEAVQNCVNVINRMRDARNAGTTTFPDAILAVFPQGTVIEDDRFTPMAERKTVLPEEQITVTYIDELGQPLEGEIGFMDNPLRVRVTSTWRTLRGGRGTATVISLLSNE